jgi:release factor glutamine methyltransferase
LQAEEISSLNVLGYINLDNILDKLEHNCPVAYITSTILIGELEFETPEGKVLIPRPETEEMVENIIERIKNIQNVRRNNNFINAIRLLDIGTGSGFISISIAKEFPEIEILAIDISGDALETAIGNAKRNNIKNITFELTDFAQFAKKNNSDIFDIIISNPPYIPSNDIKNLDESVRNWEPIIALDGGIDGLNITREIIEYFRQMKKDNINNTFDYQYCFLELNSLEQIEEIQQLLPQNYMSAPYKDSFGKWRWVEIRK